ncbi:hypothetical protein NDU88_001760 [Pleurodeles waltl]|uniref:Uncharacterized protein n=1 Tax=Pleurodeles waltl TaxID=8319 RepID=A0AAV7VAQ3_PLEWA|nr:hypothetical protein NDU88_001760 [Pleurodeles waltl]
MATPWLVRSGKATKTVDIAKGSPWSYQPATMHFIPAGIRLSSSGTELGSSNNSWLLSPDSGEDAQPFSPQRRRKVRQGFSVQ